MGRKQQRGINHFCQINYFDNYDSIFDPIVVYINKMDSNIKSAEEDIDNKVEYWQHNKSKEDTGDSLDVVETDVINTNAFKAIHYNSTFITLYSIFEIEFKKICLNCKYSGGILKSPDSFKNCSYIEKCKKFIESEIGVSLDKPDISALWDQIDKLRLIRNKVAHDQSLIENSEYDKYNEIIKSIEGIHLTHYHIEINSADFLFNFSKDIRKYLELVIKEINQQKSQ